MPKPKGSDAEQQLNISFDSDMGSDCDEVGSLYMLRGDAKLLATRGCVSSKAVAPNLDAINLKTASVTHFRRCTRIEMA